jgi:membrane-associated phospholipid phosphatase
MERLIFNKNIKIKKLKNFLISLSLMLLIIPLNLCYLLLNSSKRGVHTLVTSVDNSIPFIKVFILPYVSWYAFIFILMAYLCYKDRQIYIITLITYLLGLIASFITFYFFQTTVPRPVVIGTDYLSRMVLLIYGVDKPYNCFPSIHVLTSFLMIKAIMASSIRNKTIMTIVWASSILIIISTLFVKQHVILDVVSGIIYADLLFRIVQTYGVIIWNNVTKLYFLIAAKKKLEIE